MKKILLILCLSLAVPAFFSGCQTAPNERVQAYTTLLAVGHTAEAAVLSSAKALNAGLITNEQAQRVRDLYDKTFQPAYRIAEEAAGSNLSLPASTDLVRIATEMTSLVADFIAQNSKK